jgi:hypothetical protein
MATNVLRHRYPIVMRGGMHIADVRDVAAVVAAVMDRGRGPRSYMIAGQYVSLPDLIRTLAALSGRQIRFAILPRWFPERRDVAEIGVPDVRPVKLDPDQLGAGDEHPSVGEPVSSPNRVRIRRPYPRGETPTRASVVISGSCSSRGRASFWDLPGSLLHGVRSGRLLLVEVRLGVDGRV